MFRKRKALEQERKTFKDAVDKLWEGLHAFDSVLEHIDNEHAYAYSNIALVTRSIQDLDAMCRVYRGNHFFHMYNIMKVDGCIMGLKSLWSDLNDAAMELEMGIHSIALGKGLRDRFAESDECDPDDLAEMDDALTGRMFKAEEQKLRIHELIMNLRSILLVLREILARDLFAIMLGEDLVKRFKMDEKEMRDGMQIEVKYNTSPEAKSDISNPTEEDNNNGKNHRNRSWNN